MTDKEFRNRVTKALGLSSAPSLVEVIERLVKNEVAPRKPGANLYLAHKRISLRRKQAAAFIKKLRQVDADEAGFLTSLEARPASRERSRSTRRSGAS